MSENIAQPSKKPSMIRPPDLREMNATVAANQKQNDQQFAALQKQMDQRFDALGHKRSIK